MHPEQTASAPTTLTELNPADSAAKPPMQSQPASPAGAVDGAQGSEATQAKQSPRDAASHTWLLIVALAVMLMAGGFLRGRYESLSKWKAS